MGYRIQSAKIYKVEYDTTSCLSWEQDAFENMVRDLVEDEDDLWTDGDDYSIANQYEINKEAFKQMIEAVKNATDEQFSEWGYRDADKDYVAKCLQDLYDEADPDNDFIRLSWF